ncbi:MAG TPA: VOC family protein [Nocardioides sp.]|nr:VOC family protein [Nocardioides sp.]
MSDGGVRIVELAIADGPEAWRAAGFDVDGEVCVVGSVRLRFVGREAGRGVVGWRLSGVEGADVDGVPVVGFDTLPAEPSSRQGLCGTQPATGVIGIDHLVLMTPDLDRTVTALADIGLEPRRRRDAELGGSAVQQVFYRLGEVILEVVGAPAAHGEAPASTWGITFTVADIDATAALLGEGVGRVKDAVQPGRRITTLRGRDLGITTAVAFISERP